MSAQRPSTRICRSSATPSPSTPACAPRASTRWCASAATPAPSSRSAASCGACGPSPPALSTGGSSLWSPSRPKSIGAPSARSASDTACARSPVSSWSSATRAPSPPSSPSTRRWRASFAVTSTPSTPSAASPAPSSTTTCAARCSTAAAPPYIWAEEQPRLLPLPAHPFETELVRAVRSGKTPYVRFDRNAYSIPHTHVRKPLTLLAGATRVRILDRQTELARHRRSYDTGQTIEDPQHLEGLLAATRQSNAHTTRDRLRVAVPATATLFERLAERGEPLRAHATRLLALLDDYGPQELAAAVAVALERDALGAGSITHILETRRRQRGRKPPLRLTLPNRPGLQDIDVRPHDLETYDALSQHHPDDAGD